MRKFLLAAVLAAFSVSANAQVVPFGTLGGGSASIGSGTALGGCTSSIVYATAGSLLGCNPAAVVNGSVSTAGRSILTIQDTISGSSATSNFLNITGTFPGTLSAETSAALVSITGDNDNQLQSGLKATFSGSNTSLTNLGTAVRGHFSGAGNGTGGWFTSAVANGSTNYALIGQIQGSGAMSSAGVVGWSENTSSNFSNHGGVFSGGGGGANPTRAYGVIGMADSDAASGAMGGYFYLATSSLGPSSSIPTPSGTAGLVADNGSVAANIFEARDNGTAVFTIADGGAITATGGLTMSGSGITVPLDQKIQIGGTQSQGGSLYMLSALTPDSPSFLTGSLSNSLHLFEFGDVAFDFNNGRCGTSACTDPSLIVHSHNQATTEYVQASNDGTLAHLDGQAGTNGVGQFAFAGAKTLTESSATVVVDIPVASGAYTGATINWTVVASDATDHSSRRGSTYLAVINKAGTETCTVGDVGTTVLATSGAATLTVTTGQDTTGANVCTFTINATSSLTQTVLRAYYSVQMDGPGIPLAR